jgi:hypothetical protein
MPPSVTGLPPFYMTYNFLRKCLGAISFALPLACCTVFSQTAGMDSEVAYGFLLAPGLKHVGGGHVTGTNRQGRTEITWNAFATNQSVGDVIAFYKSKLGDQGMEGDAHGATWRFPVGATHPERVLEVAASTKDGPWRDGDRALLAKAKCVVMVSQVSRP